VQLERCTKPITSSVWEQFLLYLEDHSPPNDGLPEGYICKYCLEKFRSGVLSAKCIMNNLDYSCEPVELKDLNEFEKVLIQRAKTFQTVTKMKTVSGKRLPSSHRISSVHSSTFHLPLPLEKKLPSCTEPILAHSELYILMRSIPIKATLCGKKWLM